MYQDYDRHFAFTSFSESVTENPSERKMPIFIFKQTFTVSDLVMRFLRLKDDNPQTENSLSTCACDAGVAVQECPPPLEQVSDKSPA